MIGYLHQLSPIKTSQNKNQYFDLKLQTEQRVYRTVCFSAEKYTLFKQKYEASSPIKLTKYQLKRNNRTNDDEVLLTKRTKVEGPDDIETTFEYCPVQSDLQKPTTDSFAEDLKLCEPNTVVNISGRISFTWAIKTLNVKGKFLKKQEAVFTDESGSIRTVLWANDIDRLQSGQCYDIKEIIVRDYQQNNYWSISKQYEHFQQQEHEATRSVMAHQMPSDSQSQS